MEKAKRNWDDKQDYIVALLKWATRLYDTAETEEELAEAKRVLLAIVDGEVK